MRVMIFDDYESLSIEAAAIVAARVGESPGLVLGLATGSTPLGMYRELINLSAAGKVDFSRVTTFNLDEYYPISRDNSQSYYCYMMENFWEPAGIPLEQVHIPDGSASDVDEVCKNYETGIERKGGIDLQILGIGDNGHIGFNEPGDTLSAATHLVQLTPETIEANSRFFNRAEDVPRMALTMGMGTILKAREILLLASGGKKASAIKETLMGGISTRVPASLLQLHSYNRVTILLDKAAAAGIK